MIILVLNRTEDGKPTIEKKEASKKFYVGTLCPNWKADHYDYLYNEGKCVKYLYKNISENSKKAYKSIRLNLNDFKLCLRNNVPYRSSDLQIPLITSSLEYTKQCSTPKEFSLLIEADEFCKKNDGFNVWKSEGLMLLSKSFDSDGKCLSEDFDIEKFFPMK